MSDHPGDRIHGLGARVETVPPRDEWPDLIARITRLWAELHAADPALALELARKLPTARITLGGEAWKGRGGDGA